MPDATNQILAELLKRYQAPQQPQGNQIPTAEQEALQRPTIDPISMIAMLPTMGAPAVGRALLGRTLASTIMDLLMRAQAPKTQTPNGR